MEIGLPFYHQNQLEDREEQLLASYAFLSRNARRARPVKHADGKQEFRTEFQRDRDRIIHSRAFRRLKHKTQVFMPDEGDHYRTRLSHTLEVSQLGRSIARTLGLNEDLTEVIALAHDVGHSPFGHSGEEALHRIMSGEDSLDGELPDDLEWEGFKHNHQSLQLVDVLESKYSHPGLNLTHAVREGILRHTNIKARFGKKDVRYGSLDYSALHLDVPLFLEGQIVRLVDEIAQHTHDLEDGLRAKVTGLEDVREKVPVCAQIIGRLREEENTGEAYQVRNMLIHDTINYLIRDLCTQSYANIRKWYSSLNGSKITRDKISDNLIEFSAAGLDRFSELAEFVILNVIKCQNVDRLDARAAVIVPQLFRAFVRNPRLLPDYLLTNISRSENVAPIRALSAVELEEFSNKQRRNIRYLRVICDYIAGMTDAFAIKEYHMMVNPE